MKRQYIRGRNRILTPELKVKLCQLVGASSTIVEAAESIGVSLRTVQRERKYDEDFDHQLLLALESPPDPLKLMQSAARTHWRAAAWLLERTRPEQYARRPNNVASAAQVNKAVNTVMEAILEILPAEQRAAFFAHADAACQRALDCCFPNLGPWGHPRAPKLPPTPLTDHYRWKQIIQAPHAPDFELEVDDDAEEDVEDDATVIEDAPAPRASSVPERADLQRASAADAAAAAAEREPACREETACLPGEPHCLADSLSPHCTACRNAELLPAKQVEPPLAHSVAKKVIGDKMPTMTEITPAVRPFLN